MSLADLLERLAAAVEVQVARGGCVVAIDGPDAAGKTTLAHELGRRTDASRISIDDYLRPAAERYRRGELSAEGYFDDSFDLDALCDAISGAAASTTTPLVVDGVFLLRPELRGLWTMSIYLHISPAESLRRARLRDVDRFGSVAAVEQRYAERYLPGQALYRQRCDPEALADVFVDNSDPLRPQLLRVPPDPR